MDREVSPGHLKTSVVSEAGFKRADTDKTKLNEPLGPGPLCDPAGGLAIDAQQVDHLLIVKSFAEDLDLVETVNCLVPT